jgi:DUF971 family protein
LLYQLPRIPTHGPPAHRHQPAQSLENPDAHLRARRGYTLPAEFLRVHSPSAEVQGHGKPILQLARSTSASAAWSRPVSTHWLTFDDGHDSGLFTWEYL